jgi:tripartite ATP-independent transporter DctM subunit
MVFALGGTAIIGTYLLWEADALYLVAISTWSTLNGLVLVAIPLFLFMGNLLLYSGIADGLFDVMYKWFGRLRGGLAIGTLIICTLFAAMTGIVGAAVVSMGLIALPAMLGRGYDKRLSCGVILAGGGLGILIPPSIPFIVYGMVAGVSIGKLYAGGLIAGLLFSGLFILYTATRAYLQKDIAPALSATERLSFKEKLTGSGHIALPLLIILAVLGSIFAGIATPTEAAAVGSAATIIAVLLLRRFGWGILKDTLKATLSQSGMVMWIVIGGMMLRVLLVGIGTQTLVNDFVSESTLSPWVLFAGMMVIVLFLGMVLDANAIIVLCAAFFSVVAVGAGFDPIWFGVIFMIVVLIGYITPPFAISVFYLRGVAPEEVTMWDLYKSGLPFIVLMLLGLTLLIVFPQIVTWLPGKL